MRTHFKDDLSEVEPTLENGTDTTLDRVAVLDRPATQRSALKQSDVSGTITPRRGNDAHVVRSRPAPDKAFAMRPRQNISRQRSHGIAPALKPDRLPGIELLRAVCALLVIVLHTTPFKPSLDPMVRGFGEFINVMGRVAVPFFFLASGYFFAANAKNDLWSQVWRFTRKLLLIYLVWFCFYMLFDLYWMHKPLFSWKRLIAFLGFYGSPAGTSSRHLWFFPALIYSMIVTVLARRFLPREVVLGLMVLLFLAGNLPPAYRGFLPRWVGPLFSAPFFFAGTFLAERSWPRSRYYLLAALAAAALQFPDFLARRHFWHVTVESYFLFTMVAVPCLFLFGLQMKTRHQRACIQLGSYSLGIYVVHLLYLYITGSMHELTAPGVARNILRPAVITAASFATVFVLKKVPVLRKIG